MASCSDSSSACSGPRLRGPYLAGLTLGIAVGIPAVANRFPDLFGGETGLQLTVPYPEGGYALEEAALGEEFIEEPADLAGRPARATGPMPTADVGRGPGAGGDLLTADNFPSASASPGELLTDDTFPSAAASIDPGTLVVPDGGDGGIDVGFILERWQASLAVAVACIVGFLALNLVRGRQGHVWKAVRDDPVAAAVSGISPAGSKVSAFVVSSVFAALAGAVFAQILAYVGPGAFGLGLSLSLLVGIVLGGRASLVGAMIGAVLLVWLPEFVLQPLQRPRVGRADHQQRPQPDLRAAGRARRPHRPRRDRRHPASACRTD